MGTRETLHREIKARLLSDFLSARGFGGRSRRVEEIRAELQAGRSKFPQLYRQWQTMHRGSGEPLATRHPDALTGVMLYLRLGLYPPPELLIALVEDYERYLKGAGRVSLEEAFFGKPRRKVGSRAAATFKNAAMVAAVMAYWEYRDAGKTDREAVALAWRKRLPIDLDSFDRMLRQLGRRLERAD